jgi:hypothetical protein
MIMYPSLARIVGTVLIVVSSATEPLVAQQAQKPSPPPTSQPNPPPTEKSTQPPVELPDNPGSSASRPATAHPAEGIQEPSGTAVAPPVEIRGGAASKPAGVAIAPPKQRQVRSLLIKLGILAGAGAAIGTVVGLSAASPSHVPNSPGH